MSFLCFELDVVVLNYLKPPISSSTICMRSLKGTPWNEASY